MRVLQTLFVAASLVVSLAGFSSACTIESAFISGKLTENGFEVVSALDSKGNALEGMSGKTFAKVETAENVVLPAAAAGELVYLVADLDFDHGVLRVASATTSSATADAAVASAKVAPASGKGCCAAKSAAAASATQAASVSNAPSGSSCSSVKAASASNASHCGSAVKAAGAGSSCAYGAKVASAEGAKGVCGADCAKACCAGADGVSTAITFRVTGMTCGGCASKVQAAVAALGIEGVEAVEVDVQGGTAVVRCKGKVCTKSLKSAITEAGFPAEIAGAVAPAPAEVKS
jgi:copper chaperone CopZ